MDYIIHGGENRCKAGLTHTAHAITGEILARNTNTVLIYAMFSCGQQGWDNSIRGLLSGLLSWNRTCVSRFGWECGA
eukprot:jgi/Botrbrau1/14520/Bobra.0223s0010.1